MIEVLNSLNLIIVLRGRSLKQIPHYLTDDFKTQKMSLVYLLNRNAFKAKLLNKRSTMSKLTPHLHL